MSGTIGRDKMRWGGLPAVILAFGLMAAACGGDIESPADPSTADGDQADGEVEFVEANFRWGAGPRIVDVLDLDADIPAEWVEGGFELAAVFKGDVNTDDARLELSTGRSIDGQSSTLKQTTGQGGLNDNPDAFEIRDTDDGFEIVHQTGILGPATLAGFYDFAAEVGTPTETDFLSTISDRSPAGLLTHSIGMTGSVTGDGWAIEEIEARVEFDVVERYEGVDLSLLPPRPDSVFDAALLDIDTTTDCTGIADQLIANLDARIAEPDLISLPVSRAYEDLVAAGRDADCPSPEHELVVCNAVRAIIADSSGPPDLATASEMEWCPTDEELAEAAAAQLEAALAGVDHPATFDQGTVGLVAPPDADQGTDAVIVGFIVPAAFEVVSLDEDGDGAILSGGGGIVNARIEALDGSFEELAPRLFEIDIDAPLDTVAVETNGLQGLSVAQDRFDSWLGGLYIELDAHRVLVISVDTDADRAFFDLLVGQILDSLGIRRLTADEYIADGADLTAMPAELPDQDGTADPGSPGTSDNPIPIGTPYTFISTWGDLTGSTWTAVVNGPAVDYTQAVMDENFLNDPPGSGRAFIAVPVTFTLDASASGDLDPGFGFGLELHGPTAGASQSLESLCGVIPDPLRISDPIPVGGSTSGYFCLALSVSQFEGGVRFLITRTLDGEIHFAAS